MQTKTPRSYAIGELPQKLNPDVLAGVEVYTAISARKDRAKELFEKNGMDEAKWSKAELQEVETCNDELGRIKDYQDANSEVRHPGHSVRPGDGPPVRGFRSGYWSTPFQREVKALGMTGTITVPSLTGGVIAAEKPARLLDVVPVTGLAGTDQYSFLRETTRTHAAAPVVSSGTAIATKPVSTYAIEKVDGRAETIAHLTQPIRRQVLSDATLLQSYLEGALREGIQLALEDQIVNGDGTPPALLGLVETPNINTSVTFSGELLTTARKAVTKLEDENIFGGVFVLSSADWETIELYQSADGPFILPDNLPVDRAQRRLWGKPIVVSTALPAETGFLVDFAGSTQLFERESVRLDWSEAVPVEEGGATGFETNTIVFRAEGRFGFGVLRPAGVVMFPTAA